MVIRQKAKSMVSNEWQEIRRVKINPTGILPLESSVRKCPVWLEPSLPLPRLPSCKEKLLNASNQRVGVGCRPRRAQTLAPSNHRGISVGSPPPVDPNVGRSGEPGIEDVDAADAVGTQQRVLERRVVVEPQALPEPVDRINDHHSTGRVLYVLFLDGEVVLCARFTPADAFKCRLPGERKKRKTKEETRAEIS